MLERFEPIAGEEDFATLHRVEREIESRGYIIAPLQREDPRAIVRAGMEAPPKWRHISLEEKIALEGVMVFQGRPRRPSAIVVQWHVREANSPEDVLRLIGVI